MRPLSVVIRRNLVGLPITVEECEALREHIEQRKKSQQVFERRSFVFALVLSLSVLFMWWLKSVGII